MVGFLGWPKNGKKVSLNFTKFHKVSPSVIKWDKWVETVLNLSFVTFLYWMDPNVGLFNKKFFTITNPGDKTLLCITIHLEVSWNFWRKFQLNCQWKFHLKLFVYTSWGLYWVWVRKENSRKSHKFTSSTSGPGQAWILLRPHNFAHTVKEY